MSDQSGLRYLFDWPNMKVRKDRWLAMINDFDFEVMYFKGKEKKVMDDLIMQI